MRKNGFLKVAITLGICAALMFQGEAMVAADKVVTLKVDHQWPQNPKEPLIATVLKFTREVTEKTNGSVQFEFYPAQSLVKAKSTFKALQKGVVDMSILPYIYAAGIVPQLDFAQWECSFENHDAYFAWRKSKGYDLLEDKVNEAGVKTLVWLHYPVGIASNGKYIATPSDAKGVRFRANSRYSELLFKTAGAGITPMVSAEIYKAAERRMIDGVITSSASMAGYRLYEVFDHYLFQPGSSIVYGMEPICISLKTWNDKLNDEQRRAFLEAAEESEIFGFAQLKAHDQKVAQLFRDAGCQVRAMTESEFAQWRELAKEKVWPVKREEVPDGVFFYEDAFPGLKFNK
jgi:TRAP-type C4-dicarboxylate transport system substrate-binding protein